MASSPEPSQTPPEPATPANKYEDPEDDGPTKPRNPTEPISTGFPEASRTPVGEVMLSSRGSQGGWYGKHARVKELNDGGDEGGNRNSWQTVHDGDDDGGEEEVVEDGDTSSQVMNDRASGAGDGGGDGEGERGGSVDAAEPADVNKVGMVEFLRGEPPMPPTPPKKEKKSRCNSPCIVC